MKSFLQQLPAAIGGREDRMRTFSLLVPPCHENLNMKSNFFFSGRQRFFSFCACVTFSIVLYTRVEGYSTNYKSQLFFNCKQTLLITCITTNFWISLKYGRHRQEMLKQFQARIPYTCANMSASLTRYVRVGSCLHDTFCFNEKLFRATSCSYRWPI